MTEAIEATLAELATLEKDWNGHSAEPITAWAIREARRLLETCMPTERDACWIVPSTDGGIRLEWIFREGAPQQAELTYVIPPSAGGNYEVYIETPTPWGLEAFLAMVR